MPMLSDEPAICGESKYKNLLLLETAMTTIDYVLILRGLQLEIGFIQVILIKGCLTCVPSLLLSYFTVHDSF